MAGPREWLRLVRVPFAPTAACDAVACALLARGPGLSTGAIPLAFPEAGLLGATAVLVYAAGMLGNDLADRDRDRNLHPDRPLASGRIDVRTASIALLVLVLGAGATAWFGGLPRESAVAVALALAFSALYDVLHARWPLASAPFLGLARASNAATGVLPLVLAAKTDALALAAPLSIGLYSAAITVLSVGEDRPSKASRFLWTARGMSFVVFAAAGALALAGADGVVFWALAAPAFCLSIAFGRVPRRGPVPAQVREMMLGYYWLAMILASGGFRGSEWLPPLVLFAVAFVLIWASQMGMRLIARR